MLSTTTTTYGAVGESTKRTTTTTTTTVSSSCSSNNNNHENDSSSKEFELLCHHPPSSSSTTTTTTPLVEATVTTAATSAFTNNNDIQRHVYSASASPSSKSNNSSSSLYCSDDDGYDDDDLHHPSLLSEQLLAKASNFTIPHDVERGYRATRLGPLSSWERPHMRAFHGAWICFFLSVGLQFSVCPILPEMATSLHLSKSDVWLSNIWSMVGGIPCALCLGSLCDEWGARILNCGLLWISAVLALAMTTISSLRGLILLRFLIGCTDTFVSTQYWIVCHFTRNVVGTTMAIAGGWGASGAGIIQLFVGTVLYPIITRILHVILDDDNDNVDKNNDHTTTTSTSDTTSMMISNLAWRLALVPPALVAMYVAYFFYNYSDDCPLGNYNQVKRAGLMMEKSAVDSFRSGALNVNSWILFLQFAGSCGVDLTMCNGTAIYYHEQFHQSIASAGAIAFLYGISSIYARGLGGYVSDVLGHAHSLRGRLVAQMTCMIVQGLCCVWFAHVQTVASSIFVMVVFSILVQMSMGTCFGIVSYVDGPNTGTVAGIVGSGGNVGAVWLGIVFMSNESYQYAMEYMGWFTVVLAFLTPLIVIKGYRGLIFGKEEELEPHLTLMVPS